MIMKFEDLKRLYEEKRIKYGNDAYMHISELLQEAKEIHRKDWEKSHTPQKDHGQSWKPFKGKNLEKLIIYIIEREVTALGLKITTDEKLESTKLTEEFSRVRRNLVVHYGEYDVVPDSDIVIYDPEDFQVIAVISSKVTLRERIAQTAYWKKKLDDDPVTQHIKSFFVSPDEDGDLINRLSASGNASRGFKGRIIVEYDTDGAYVLREVEESEKVKTFPKLIDDIKRIRNEKKKPKSNR